MSKVTSKRQVTAGQQPGLSLEECLRLFDQATERQREREIRRNAGATEGAQRPTTGRGWTREDLYERGPTKPDAAV